MYYVGLDVHSRQSTFCVLDNEGTKVLSRTIHGRWDKVLEELHQVKRPFTVCFEASTGYGPLHDGLRGIADRVVMAHPGHLRLIFGSKRKNDRVDAAKLALLLHAGIVQPVHVPSSRVRGWRRLIEHRHALVAERTRVKNRTRALLRSVGARPPKGLWTQNGMTWLRTVEFSEPGDALQRDLRTGRCWTGLPLPSKHARQYSCGKSCHLHPTPSHHSLSSFPTVHLFTPAESELACAGSPDRPVLAATAAALS